MRLGAEKRCELQLVLAQHLLDHLAIARAQVQDAQLAFHVRDVLDDFVGLLLAQGKVVVHGIKLPDHIDKCVDRKGIMLARNREVRHLARLATIALLEQIDLLEDLACISQKGLALLGHHHALVGTLENSDPHLSLKVTNGSRDGWLRDKQTA